MRRFKLFAECLLLGVLVAAGGAAGRHAAGRARRRVLGRPQTRRPSGQRRPHLRQRPARKPPDERTRSGGRGRRRSSPRVRRARRAPGPGAGWRGRCGGRRSRRGGSTRRPPARRGPMAPRRAVVGRAAPARVVARRCRSLRQRPPGRGARRRRGADVAAPGAAAAVAGLPGAGGHGRRDTRGRPAALISRQQSGMPGQPARTPYSRYQVSPAALAPSAATILRCSHGASRGASSPGGT